MDGNITLREVSKVLADGAMLALLMIGLCWAIPAIGVL